jgi:hypothetical protein
MVSSTFAAILGKSGNLGPNAVRLLVTARVVSGSASAFRGAVAIGRAPAARRRLDGDTPLSPLR